MPSAFTHAIVGASAMRFLPREVPPARVGIFLAVAAAIPDLDVLAFTFGIPYASAFGHRGFSHSLLFALLLGAFTPVLLPCGLRSKGRLLVAVSAIGTAVVASHGLLDALTDAGLGIGFFVPFSDTRYFFPVRPIETASVNPIQFFSRRGLTVLSSEIVWVWLPLVAFSSLYQLGKLIKAARNHAHG